MDYYKPRYPQPFTLAEATALDLSVISKGRVVILEGNLIAHSRSRDLKATEFSHASQGNTKGT